MRNREMSESREAFRKCVGTLLPAQARSLHGAIEGGHTGIQ